VEVLYLDQEQWQWWKWHKKCYLGQPNWTMLTKVVCARFDKEYHFLGWLTKLKQTRLVEKFITAFEQLDIITKGLSYEFYLECFLSGLKHSIRAHFCVHYPINWLHAWKLSLQDDAILHSPLLRYAVPNRPHLGVTPTLTQTFKVQKVSPTNMVERKK
jgi:hypothetical protein